MGLAIFGPDYWEVALCAAPFQMDMAYLAVVGLVGWINCHTTNLECPDVEGKAVQEEPRIARGASIIYVTDTT